METVFWTFQSAAVTLKLWSRIAASWSAHFFFKILFKINLSGISFLEIMVQVTKLKSTISLLTTMYLCKFGQNPSTNSEETAQKPYFEHFKVPL